MKTTLKDVLAKYNTEQFSLKIAEEMKIFKPGFMKELKQASRKPKGQQAVNTLLENAHARQLNVMHPRSVQKLMNEILATTPGESVNLNALLSYMHNREAKATIIVAGVRGGFVGTDELLGVYEKLFGRSV